MNAQLKRILVIAALSSSLLAGAAITYAQDSSTVDLPHFTDGRINQYDIAAPIVIYENDVYPFADDVNMGVLDTIDFWAPNSDGVFDKVIEITADQIRSADTSHGSVVIAAGDGYEVYKEVDGSLTVIGHSYQFNWTPSL